MQSRSPHAKAQVPGITIDVPQAQIHNVHLHLKLMLRPAILFVLQHDSIMSREEQHHHRSAELHHTHEEDECTLLSAGPQAVHFSLT
jgi:hypothetical protein